MKIDVSALFSDALDRIPVDTALSFLEEKRCGKLLLPAPVAVQGEVRNRCGVVEFSYTADFDFQTACDRCLTDVTRHCKWKFSHTLVPSLNREEEQEFIVVSDGQLDLAELVRSDILLELPSVVLCDDGCQGLCPVCGRNRNREACSCQTRTASGPFAALLGMFPEEDGQATD